MQLTTSEKDLLLEVLGKHIYVAESDLKSVVRVTSGNKARREKAANKVANLQNLRMKVSMMNAE